MFCLREQIAEQLPKKEKIKKTDYSTRLFVFFFFIIFFPLTNQIDFQHGDFSFS